MKKPLHLQDLKAALEVQQPKGEGLSESDCKRKLVEQVNSHSGRALRIEHRWAPGVLDMIIKLPTLPTVWAEGKLIEGNLFAPTAIQYEEGVKWQEANVQCVLIGWKNGQMYVSPWAKQTDYRDCFTIPQKSYAEILWHYLTGGSGEHS